ncbi:MAG: hypothetical protein ACLFQR_13815 [Desulfovibrionales bacterium]
MKKVIALLGSMLLLFAFAVQADVGPEEDMQQEETMGGAAGADQEQDQEFQFEETEPMAPAEPRTGVQEEQEAQPGEEDRIEGEVRTYEQPFEDPDVAGQPEYEVRGGFGSGITRTPWGETISQYDMDDDGQISQGEWVNAGEDPEEFDELDQNNSGFLEEEEWPEQ